MGVIMRNGVQYAGSNGGGGASSAIDVSYDNETSQLSASNVQTAIDEVVEMLDGVDATVPSMTQDEYNAHIDEYKDKLVYVTDAEGGGGSGTLSADKVSYDNALTQLPADNVQTAIDKISIKVAEFTPSELPVTNFTRSKNGVYYKNIDLPSELANSVIIGFQLKNWSGCNGLFTVNYYEPLNCIQIMAASSITINVFTINIIYI